MKEMALFVFIGLLLLALPVRAQISLLHEFAGGVADGQYPHGDLLLNGTTLYGVTGHGGDGDSGTIFKVQANGASYTLLHSFGAVYDAPRNPCGSLILSGTTLYGMTTSGGSSNVEDRWGTIFKIETDGTGFTVLHKFTRDKTDGGVPLGSLIVSGSTLFGMTFAGGENDSGTIFSIQTDGTLFTLLHSFSYNDGRDPCGSLILSGTTLYGMTSLSGYQDWGSIFKIETNGSGFALLHKFADFPGDGQAPYGSLILSGSTLYGMTMYGGNYNYGSIFKIQTDGSEYAVLHSFSGRVDDGSYPRGDLALKGSTLFGMTYGGITANNMSFEGTIFKIETDGTGFSSIHEFASDSTDGQNPFGSLILSDWTLFGMTSSGGKNDKGVLFSFTVPTAITIIAPNGGEKWIEGSSHMITWTSSGPAVEFKIDYTIDNGANWTQVAAGKAGRDMHSLIFPVSRSKNRIKNSIDLHGNLDPGKAGTANAFNYLWAIPHTPSTICKVRINDAADASVGDLSDALFSILMNLSLQVERREVKSFSMVKQYGQIQFMITHPEVPVAEYRVLRSEGTANFVLIRTVIPSELQNNQFQMQDKFLDKNTEYTYIVEAYNSASQLVGRSTEKTI